MAEKSDLELLQEILEEQRKQALWHDIQLHYLKCMAIAHPKDDKIHNNDLEKNQQEV